MRIGRRFFRQLRQALQQLFLLCGRRIGGDAFCSLTLFFFGMCAQQGIGLCQFGIDIGCGFGRGLRLQFLPLLIQQLQLAVKFRVVANFVQVFRLRQQIVDGIGLRLLFLLGGFMRGKTVFTQAVNGFVFTLRMVQQLLQQLR